MMRSNISRLAVLGLAAISGQVFAAVSLDGEVRLDTKFVSEPNGGDDTMAFERIRLNVKGDVSSDWVAGLRLEKAEAVGSESIELKRAYASWTGLENHTVTLGKAGHIAVDADDSYYAPYVTQHGVLKTDSNKGFSSNDMGASLSGAMGAFGYKLGLAKTTTLDGNGAEGNPLKWSMGGRAHFTAMNSDNMSWGVGAGMVNRQHALVLFEVNSTDSTDGTTTNEPEFYKFSGMTLDISGVMGKIAATGAMYTGKDKYHGLGFESNATTAQTPIPASIFEKDGKSSSYYIEAAYLVMGDGYGFSNAVITGPKFKSSALEIGARLSNMTQKDAAVVLNGTALSASFTGELAATDKLEQKTKATSMFANYHVNSNAVVKVELYNSKRKTTVNPVSVETTAPNAGLLSVANQADVKNKHLAIRAQFKF